MSENDPIREELDSHLAMRQEWLSRQGADPSQARRMFGNTGKTYEDTRRVHVAAWLDGLLGDLRYAWRGLRRSPGFTLTAIATLALGIGAASAVFSVVDRILFRPLGYAHEDRLVWFGMQAPITGPDEFVLGADYKSWQEKQTMFEGLTSFQGRADCTLLLNEPILAGCARIEANFLPLFGFAPRLGRNFTAEEDRENGPNVILIAERIWRQYFGGRDSVVGERVTLDGRLAEIIGVLPDNFELPNMARPAILMPQQINWSTQVRGESTIIMQALARLKPGVTLPQADAAMQSLFVESLKFVPERFRKEVKFRVHSLRDRQIRHARRGSILLLSAVCCLLLIACLNVANLLVARGESRQNEFATRAAIGASRGVLIRQMLVESVLLGLAGCAVGLALGQLLLKIFVAAGTSGIPRLSDAILDWRVMSAALACSFVTALLFGLGPVTHARGADSLSGQRSTRRARPYVRQGLVAAQLGISLLLLSAAGLLAQSLHRLSQVNLGFQPNRLLTVPFVIDPIRYRTQEQRNAFLERLDQALSHIPGVEAAAVSDSIPPSGRTLAMIYSNIEVEGRPRIPQGTGGMIVHRYVSPSYFQTLGIAIRRGRGFTEADRIANDALVISESLAAKVFPGEEALGRRVRLPQQTWKTLVGIVENVRNAGIKGGDDPEYYELYGKEIGPRSAFATIRTPASVEGATRMLKEEIHRLDSTIPVEVQSVESRVSRLRAEPRFQAWLIGFFAFSGLLLAVIGLYGVLSFLIARRTREIGIRMAIGAAPSKVARMVLGQAGKWIAAGVALGIAGALGAGQWLQGLLFGVRPTDPSSLAAVSVLLAVVALAAAWVPARRAAKVEPAQALRSE